MSISTSSGLLLHVALLGPFQASWGGSPLEFKGRQLPQLLALFALNAERPVSTDRIIDVLWEDSPPLYPRRMALNLVGRLRRMLGDLDPGLLDCASRSLFTLRRCRTDVESFDRALRSAASDHRAERADDALKKYELALSLVRGDPLSGWDGAFFSAERARLERAVREAEVRRASALNDTGAPAAALEFANRLLDREPLFQEAVGQALRAKASMGDAAGASALFHGFRERLAEEAGVDPSASLSRAYARALSAPVQSDGEPAVPVAAPRQLPMVPTHFVGRADEVSALVGHFTDACDSGVRLATVNGTGGVGKSALAVFTAHRLAECFPDGQLYVNLNGATPGADPLAPGEVLERFLRSLGHEPVERAGLDEVAAQFRTAVSGRRMLVVLDDARDADQVAPLLPGSGSCAVLVTSRCSLAGMDPGVNLHLRPLAWSSSVNLLRRCSQGASLSQVDWGVLAGHCAGMPLALRIVAARLESDGGTAPDQILAAIEDERRRLGEMDDGQRDLRSVLAVSLRALESSPSGREARDLFFLTGSFPGDTVSLHPLAALAESTPQKVAATMRTLVRQRLAEPVAAGRFRLHDLLRLFAREEDRNSAVGERRDRIRRLVGFYASSGRNVLELEGARLWKRVNRIAAAGFAPGRSFASLAEGERWLDDELPSLIALLWTVADEHPDLAHEGKLLFHATFPAFMYRGSRLSEYTRALRRLTELSEADWDYAVHGDIAEQYRRVGDMAEARRHLDISVDLVRRNGETGTAVQLMHRTLFALEEERWEDAEESAVVACRAAEAEGEPRAAAIAWVHRALVRARRGDFAAALAASTESLRRDMADPFRDLSVSLSQHGFRLIDAGVPVKARICFAGVERDLDRRGRRRSDSYVQALWGLGEVCWIEGRKGEARDNWIAALTIAEEIGLVGPEIRVAVEDGRHPWRPRDLMF
ncbi:AfsR/SARP family transcriptional regulator [Salininema proteolyticum]|uniref:BTAD domain-containing putative transcriptional regulator n=1 Tax=Salininema proteolyticum TaxID=1607685 RepID=A0ABV8TUA3_9ACTN